ncbi:MAG TPA: alpha/beta fold hydrolase [Rhodocyclaceae bacterium]|nr:alpha/beta fold hydrolase [Rhodocyclaceae bacterium]
MNRAAEPLSLPVTLYTADGYALAAHHWPTVGEPCAVVVINPATAVKAGYYHRFARFLAERGMAVLTYDYRGIGASRQGNLRRHRHFAKLDWGRYDCDAALAWAHEGYPGLPLYVVAHSIGGLVVGLAANNRHVDRCFTVGAQYAYWPDYARDQRLSMWLRWHVLMPLLTLFLGYFPARKLGWHEDLPAAAAFEWAFRPARLERSYRRHRRSGPDPLAHFGAMTAELLAVAPSDDPFATPAALRRLLGYFHGSRRRTLAIIPPASVGEESIGHFAFFHERFRPSLWEDAARWLESGALSSGRSQEWEVSSPP